MGLYDVKPTFQRLLKPLSKVLSGYNVDPTWINVAALLFSGIAGYLLATEPGTPWLAIPLLVFGRIAANALDGMVARANNVSGQAWGEVLNEVVDRASDAVIFLGLAANPMTSTVLGGAAAACVLLSAFTGVVSKAAGGHRRYDGIMGKADRMVVIGVLGIVGFFAPLTFWGNVALGVVSLGCLATVAERLIMTRTELLND